jgi:hypothetical protein
MLRKSTAQVEVLVDVLVEGVQGAEALSKMLMVVVIKLLVMMEEKDDGVQCKRERSKRKLEETFMPAAKRMTPLCGVLKTAKPLSTEEGK